MWKRKSICWGGSSRVFWIDWYPHTTMRRRRRHCHPGERGSRLVSRSHSSERFNWVDVRPAMYDWHNWWNHTSCVWHAILPRWLRLWFWLLLTAALVASTRKKDDVAAEQDRKHCQDPPPVLLKKWTLGDSRTKWAWQLGWCRSGCLRIGSIVREVSYVVRIPECVPAACRVGISGCTASRCYR